MPYRLTQFGSADLPTWEPEHGLGAASNVLVMPLPGGGVFDVAGAEIAPSAPRLITCRGVYVDTEVDAAYTAIMRQLGRRDQLKRKRDNDSSEEWCYARLQEVRADRTAEFPTTLPVELDFAMISPCWYGIDKSADYTLDAVPKIVTLTNGGNARVANAVVTVTAHGSAITQVKVTALKLQDLQWITLSEFQWDGTLAAGNSLIIDCGALTVTNNGLNAYKGFRLTANHKQDDWLRIEPGENTVRISRTGGDNQSTAHIAYCEGWV